MLLPALSRFLGVKSAALLALTALTPLLDSQMIFAQETRKVPKDSVEIEARGCLKGRVFTAIEQLDEEEVSRRTPDISGRSFRVAGPREAMDLIKRYDAQLVEIVGIVRRAALDDAGIGMRVGGARVVIGAPGQDPTRMNTPATPPSVATMDVIAVRLLADKCPLQ